MGSSRENLVILSSEACDRRLGLALLEVTQQPIWDQGVWICTDGVPEVTGENGWPCGTVACLAGVGCIQAGACDFSTTTAFGYRVWAINERYQELLTSNPRARRTENAQFDFGGLATVLFGLMNWQATELFHTDNTLDRLWRLAHQHTAGRVTLPPELTEQVRLVDEAQVKTVVST